MSETQINAVLESFRFALSLYGLHVNLTGVLSELPREDVEKITLDDIEGLASKINVQIKIQKKSLKSIKNNEFPIILLLKDEKTCVVMPHKTHEGKIYVPGSGVHEKNILDFKEEFTGKVITINPRAQKAAQADSSVFSDWIWGPVTNHWDQFVQVILASFFINLFALALPLYTMNVYDSVVPNFALDTLAVLTTGVFLALAFDFLFKVLRGSILEKLSSDLGKRFDFELMERLMQIPALKLNMSVGRRSNLFREVQGLRDFYATRLGPAMVDFPFFLLFIVVIGSISLKIVMVPITAAIFILSLSALTHRSIKKRTAKLFQSMQDKSSFMIEMLEGTETLKLFNGTGNALFKWNVQSQKSSQATQNSNFMMAWTQHASTSAMHMVNVFVIIVGVYEIQSGALTVGGLIASTILSSRSLAPIMALSGTLSQMKKSAEVLKTIKHLFMLPTENEHTRTTGELGQIKGKIKFRNVSFSYPNQAVPALNGVSFEISSGEKVAVIGKNGAGKSTIANLINGILKTTDGNVLIDNQAIESMNLAELRTHIGIVPQKSFFFSGTLRDNIMMGRAEIDQKRFQDIIDLSGLSLFLEQTSRGLDTEIGENGERLSGGQQQSIAIARALLHDPEIMIFDEPTSAMDQGLESQIKDTFSTYLKEKTLILVTHRTTLLGLVQRILYLDQGQVVADGPRDEIMKKLSGGG